MNFNLDASLAEDYEKQSQKVRIMTEDWVDKNIYCPNCGNLDIERYENNKPVADFFCSNCSEDYELKSKKNNIGSKINDGAYDSMISRLSDVNNPNFFLLTYKPTKLVIKDFLIIPKHYFVPDIIEKRKELSPTARRAGWVGCNILINQIPQSGRIFYIQNRQVIPKETVLNNWKKTLFLKEEKDITAKGWLLDIMKCIESLGQKDFILDQLYSFENELNKKHPNNHHIRDKIRQQLQYLRDKNHLEFTGNGKYKLKS